jgi:hypothetical protein
MIFVDQRIVPRVVEDCGWGVANVGIMGGEEREIRVISIAKSWKVLDWMHNRF